MFEELIKTFNNGWILRINFDLKFNTQQYCFFIDPLRHPSNSVGLEHLIALFLDNILFQHQILIGFMRIFSFKSVFRVFEFIVNDLMRKYLAFFE